MDMSLHFLSKAVDFLFTGCLNGIKSSIKQNKTKESLLTKGIFEFHIVRNVRKFWKNVSTFSLQLVFSGGNKIFSFYPLSDTS